MSFLKVKPLEVLPQETSEEYTLRLKTEEAKARQWKWFLVGAGCFLLAVCFLVATSAVRNSNNYFDLKAKTDRQIAALEKDFGELEASNQKLKSENEAFKTAAANSPKMEFTGATLDDIKKYCVGKTVYTAAVSRPPRAHTPSNPPQETQKKEVSHSGQFWGWVHPESAPDNKKVCLADRQIAGMPARCSKVEILTRKGTETEVEWNARAAKQFGIYVGNMTDKGRISGTTFAHVKVGPK